MTAAELPEQRRSVTTPDRGEPGLRWTHGSAVPQCGPRLMSVRGRLLNSLSVQHPSMGGRVEVEVNFCALRRVFVVRAPDLARVRVKLGIGMAYWGLGFQGRPVPGASPRPVAKMSPQLRRNSSTHLEFFVDSN